MSWNVLNINQLIELGCKNIKPVHQEVLSGYYDLDDSTLKRARETNMEKVVELLEKDSLENHL
jgi:hypothetical protein